MSPAPPRFYNRRVFRITAYLREKARASRLGELILWCLPALLLGLALRIALTSALPYAFFHDDTTDFILTADRLLNEHKLSIHEKKSFLSPVLFTLPFLLHLPAMVAVPIAHHLMGLGMLLLTGALCRLWLARWKLFIIPVTLLTSANPSLLWYEHTLMAETHFVFCLLLVALAGSLYAKAQTRGRFVFLCTALFLSAGTRPEGKLLFGFASLLLVMLHFREWRPQLPRLGIFLAVAGLAFFLSRTSQAGLLLYTSVAKFTPQELRCAPGYESYIAPVRAALLARSEQLPSFPRVRTRKEISRVVNLYLDERGNRESREAFCLRLAKETCLRSLTKLPAHTFQKFRYHCCDSPAELLDEHMIFKKQREAYMDRADLVRRLARGLFWREIASDDELNRFIDASYREVAWFNALSKKWYDIAARWRLPDQTYRNPDFPAVPFVYHGIPLYMIAALAGLLFAIFRSGPLLRFHIAWGVSLLLLLFVIMLTANVRARFRFFLEPFWFLYIALLVDCLLCQFARLRRKK